MAHPEQICTDCGGDCETILEALRKALNLPRFCHLCGAAESPEVGIRRVGDGFYCFHCATELYS